MHCNILYSHNFLTVCTPPSLPPSQGAMCFHCKQMPLVCTILTEYQVRAVMLALCNQEHDLTLGKPFLRVPYNLRKIPGQ